MPRTPLRLPTLSARRITQDRNGRRVLTDISLRVGPGDRLGIVGPNGVGKSTLLNILGGRLKPDSGWVRVDPPEAAIGLVAQEHPVAPRASPGTTVAQHLSRSLGVAEAEEALQRAAQAVSDALPGAIDAYDRALTRLQALGTDDIDAQTSATLADVGLDGRLDQPVDTLSGGERARLALATVALSHFGLTLLDEPTNDLDFGGLERLEDLVTRHPGGLVLVSHDREFMARCVTEVLEIDEHDHTAAPYGGGWEGYLKERATARSHAEQAYARYDRRRRELKARAQRERQWATRGVAREHRVTRDDDKVQRGFRINRTEQLASRARRTQRALGSLNSVEKPWEGWQLRYVIGDAPRAGAVVARLDGAIVEQGAFRLGPINLEISWADRIALTGANGSGKTTLVQALVGDLALTEGTRWLGPGVKLGQLGQDRVRPLGERTLLQGFKSSTSLSETEARGVLASFGLDAMEVGRPWASLSAGQRTRAHLARFQALGINFLVLDEPTNHLDLPAIEQLEAALRAYPGTLVVVTHDRRMLQSVSFTERIELR